MESNKNIVLIGMPGCGKTTIGKILADKLKLDFYDIDEYIETKQNMSIKDIFKNGEECFRKLECKAVKEISYKTRAIISTGGGVIKDKANIDNLNRNGLIIFINRPLEDIISDINSSTRPLLEEGKKKLYKLYEERYNLYKEYCDYEIINDSSIDAVVNKTLKVILCKC